MRVMCAATLVFEALAVLLAIAPTVVLTDVPAGWVVAGGLVLALLGVAAAGSLRRPSGYRLGFAVQLLVLATGFVLPAMFSVGVLFAGLWVASYVLGRRMEADKARWAAEAAAAGSAGTGSAGSAGTGSAEVPPGADR